MQCDEESDSNCLFVESVSQNENVYSAEELIAFLDVS